MGRLSIILPLAVAVGSCYTLALKLDVATFAKPLHSLGLIFFNTKNNNAICDHFHYVPPMTLRNIILLAGLSLFLLWYVSNWAYTSQYLKPRKQFSDEIAKLSGEIERGQNYYAALSQFCQQNQLFYARSLPRVQNDAKQYSFWLLELLQLSGLENINVADGVPISIPFGADYRFTVQCAGTLSQLSYFLFEFYYAPFLHRISTLKLVPDEKNKDKMTFTMTISALALRPRDLNDPYPAMNQIPGGWYVPRLASSDLATYQVIPERNLLQTAKGGIDKADYTILTAILQIDGQEEVWFSVQTDDDPPIKLKHGDQIVSGSFSGTIVEIHEQDIVLDRNGTRWLLTTGETLTEAFALPPESE